MLAQRRPTSVSLALVLVVSLAVAACGGGEGDADGGPSIAPAADVSPGSGGPDPSRNDSTDGDPTDGDPTDRDPTDGDPTPAETTGSDSTVADPLAGTAGPAVPPAVDGGAPGIDPAAGVSGIVAAMTLEQKVGQLFTVTVIGDDATDVSAAAASQNTQLYGVPTPAEVVARYHLGGVAYFDHQQGEGTSNVADLSRTASLSTGLQQAAAAGSGIGLLIGADQEGGSVVRLHAPATVFPSARDIAATQSTDLAQEAGRVTGTEALAVGINWVYAPVADVNVDPDNPVIGDRAFGTTAAGTTPWVLATARGISGAGALPTLKHFPGHGDTDIDSHSSLPTIGHDLATLAALDFPPFAAGVGVADPVSVMVGHLAVPAIDPSGLPASLSAPIVGLLRADPSQGGLGFDGLVITDAMDMGALNGFGDAGTLAVGAINAGIDMVVMPTDLPTAWNAVLAAAQDGSISMARIDQAVTRILRAKESIRVLRAEAIPAANPALLGSPDHAAVLADIRAACNC